VYTNDTHFQKEAEKMKIARCILKLLAVATALTAVICCVIAYWDKISDAVRALGDKLGLEIELHRGGESDDYADWED